MDMLAVAAAARVVVAVVVVVVAVTAYRTMHANCAPSKRPAGCMAFLKNSSAVITICHSEGVV
jgi:hypothetical protein